MLFIPTAALPSKWLVPILSDLPPRKAVEQANIQVGTTLGEDEIDKAVIEWLKVYGDSSMVSVPGLSILIEYEEKSKYGDIWFPVTATQTNLWMLCG